jgi:hypothetical protein
MDEQKLQAIEQRLLSPNLAIEVGDKVIIEDFFCNRKASGVVTQRDGEVIWLDDKPTQYWCVDARRDEPSMEDDTRALLAEVRRLQEIESRAVTINNALLTAVQSMMPFLTPQVQERMQQALQPVIDLLEQKP